MREHENLIKTYTDEVMKIKSQLLASGRKETGNLTARDYTDEVYNNERLEKRHFVQGMLDGFASKAFTNLLCVINKSKLMQFQTEIPTLMEEFYESLNATEIKRRPEYAKQAFRETMEKSAAEILEFCISHEIVQHSV